MEVIYFVIKRCRKEYHNGLFKIKYGLCNEVIDTTLMNTSKIKRNIITFQTHFYFHITQAHIHNCVSPGPTGAKHKCSSGTKKNREYISMFSSLGQIYKFACCFLYVFICGCQFQGDFGRNLLEKKKKYLCLIRLSPDNLNQFKRAVYLKLTQHYYRDCYKILFITT